MSSIYFGKFDKNKPQQIQEHYYAGGPQGDPWYGGIKPGDYVFGVSNVHVFGLWRVIGYGDKKNPINPKNAGVAFFDEVEPFDPPIPVVEFIKSPYFDIDISFLNKIIRATKGRGFFPIRTTSLFPMGQWNQLNFKRQRRLYVALPDSTPPLDEHDIVVAVDNDQDGRILQIYEWRDGAPRPYTALQDLYEMRNAPDERYTLRELLKFAEEEAPQKKQYLQSVLAELGKTGYFTVTNPVQLYDNILVGRRRTPTSKGKDAAATDAVTVDPSAGFADSSDPDEEWPEPNEEYMRYAELLEYNPNLILYGPPGTGKTYATKHIIEAVEYKRHNRHIPFARVQQEERVRFITFHQSYSYEEFIEGIRPRMDESEEGDLRYRIEPGVLKQLAEAASTQMVKSEIRSAGVSDTELIRPNSKVWKVSLGRRNDNEIYERCKRERQIAVGWLEGHDLTDKTYDDIYTLLESGRTGDDQKPTMDASTLDALLNQMEQGDLVFIYNGPTTIRDIGVVTGDYRYLKGGSYPHVRSVTWLKEYDRPVDIGEMNGGVRLTLKTIYELPRIQMSDVLKLIGNKDNGQMSSGSSPVPAGALSSASADESPAYYLVIDEINRGNISKIFGELMTLIEKDKRQTIHTVLPYSKKPFTLPANLYLIGTMNTADRSIAMLDTALRRRFAFVEVEPNYEVFAENTSRVGAVELDKLLLALNGKIAEKLDRDHRIGHAYLMDVYGMGDLYKAWYYKVLPLIAEYFYNDVPSIQAVTGKAFIDKSGSFVMLDHTPAASGDAPSKFEQALLAIYKGNASE